MLHVVVNVFVVIIVSVLQIVVERLGRDVYLPSFCVLLCVGSKRVVSVLADASRRTITHLDYRLD